ncbi:hypothetical protein I7I53_10130 [Histoplasma capsulatum var. duboisii H88]|uniref:Uncharacterized protein n=1 Tax=Ajellomyces capsulatus (strain H88) TaxID=544711 RepID=A0A8A1L7V2_AJEC8|nr:hypothetical protein I7I53_10130 [Histoplasma capsulatum var. duboisii H88]
MGLGQPRGAKPSTIAATGSFELSRAGLGFFEGKRQLGTALVAGVGLKEKIGTAGCSGCKSAPA